MVRRIVIATVWLAVQSWAGDALGIWKVDRPRSTAPYGDILTVRFEPHAKGEVFTMDRTDADGRNTTSSTILYFDGSPRDFQDSGCSGTQSSRRVDGRTVEILRNCTNGQWIRFIRRLAGQPRELILEITQQQPDGHRLERRLVLKKQSGEAAYKAGF